MIEVFLDENFSHHVASALNLLNINHNRNITILSTGIEFGPGMPDEDLIPNVASRGGLLLTQDRNIRRVKALSALCRQYKLGIFFFKLPDGQSRHWDIVKCVVNKWEEIIVHVNDDRPFSFLVKPNKKLEVMKLN